MSKFRIKYSTLNVTNLQDLGGSITQFITLHTGSTGPSGSSITGATGPSGSGISSTGPTGPAGATGPNILPAVNHILWVTQNGSDTTGNGSYNNPYASISFAMSTIAGASLTNTYAIFVGPGRIFDPATTLFLKPFVWIIGDNYESSYIRINNGAGSLQSDASFSGIAGGTRCGIANLYLGGGSSINFNLQGVGPNIGTPSCTFSITNCYVTGLLTILGRTPGIDFLEMYNSLAFGNTILDSISASSVGTQYEGNLNLLSTYAGSNSNYIANYMVGTCNMTGSFSNLQQFSACTLSSTVLCTGSNITATFDAVSRPIASNLITGGGATVNNSNDVSGLNYTPGLSSNWTNRFGSIPSNTQTALDLLVSGSTNISTTNLKATLITGTNIFTNGVQNNTLTTATSITLNSTGPNVVLTGTTTTQSITFPKASTLPGYTYKLMNGTSNNWTLTPFAGDTLKYTLLTGGLSIPMTSDGNLTWWGV